MTIHALGTHLQSLRVLTPGDAAPLQVVQHPLEEDGDVFIAEHDSGAFEQEGEEHGLRRIVFLVADEALETLMVEPPSDHYRIIVGDDLPSEVRKELVGLGILSSCVWIRTLDGVEHHGGQTVAHLAEYCDRLVRSVSEHSSAGLRVGRSVFLIHVLASVEGNSAPSVVVATEGHPSAPQSQRLQQRRYDQDDHASAICKHSEWRLGDRSNSANSAVNQRISRDSVKGMSSDCSHEEDSLHAMRLPFEETTDDVQALAS